MADGDRAAYIVSAPKHREGRRCALKSWDAVKPGITVTLSKQATRNQRARREHYSASRSAAALTRVSLAGDNQRDSVTRGRFSLALLDVTTFGLSANFAA